MRVTIEDVNKWAMNSCPRYCNSKARRSFYQTLYLTVVESFIKTPMQKEITEETLAGKYWCNSYPWPYCQPEFANWPEHHSKQYYSLVTDLSGCIVKHDTSYIAWKIREATGEWPTETDKIKFTEFDWILFLANSGFHEIAEAPKRKHKYVGVYSTNQKETVGVWYEKAELNEQEYKGKPIIVTTYLDKEFKVLRVNPKKFTWVKIK